MRSLGIVVSSWSFALVAVALVGCHGASQPPPWTATASKAGSARYIVGGDSRDDAAHVLPWAFREAQTRGASAFFFLGDMELTPQFRRHFEEELDLLGPVPFYPVLGNHEVSVLGFIPFRKAHEVAKFRERFLNKGRTPAASTLPEKVVYSVDLPAGLHFVALDNVSQNGFGVDQLAWLAADLDRAHANPSVKHIVVGMHKPLANNGISKHGMDRDGAQAIQDSQTALDLFVKDHVSLVVASHVHEFAQYAQSGIPSYITGGLGAPLDRSGADHAFHHFLQLDVSDEGIHVETVRFDGPPSITDEAEAE